MFRNLTLPMRELCLEHFLDVTPSTRGVNAAGAKNLPATAENIVSPTMLTVSPDGPIKDTARITPKMIKKFKACITPLALKYRNQ